MNTITRYYQLTKPERTLTNVLTAAAGFFFAVTRPIDWWLFVALLVGTTLVIASACVLNNYFDRQLDKKMERTKKRALVRGEISVRAALTYAVVLGALGFFILGFTNWLTVAVGATAFVGYVGLYGVAKRRSVHGTLIGTLPGGASLVAGYTAVTGQLGMAALLLFVLMAAWQMAHFYAIAIYRVADYRAAGVPVWSVKKGILSTKVQITVYTYLFIMAILMLSLLGYTGYTFMIVMGLFGLYWLFLATRSFGARDSEAWARQFFRVSLVIVLVMSVMLALGPHLP